MKKAILLSALFFLATLFAVAHFNPTAPAREAVAAQPAVLAAPESASKDPFPPAPTRGTAPATAPALAGEESLPTANALTESNWRDVYSLASSHADAIWLRAHGYPSTQQLREYDALPLGDLESRAKAGDLVAKALAGTRLALAHRNPEGVLLLQEAAVEGSIFALGQLASVYGMRGPLQNPVLSEAYRRLALTRGDHAMAGLRLHAALTPADWARAEGQFLRLAGEYAQARVERNLPPLQMETRPGLDDALTRLGNAEAAAPPPSRP